MTRHLAAWLADILLGPACPIFGCRHRARGPRSLFTHLTHAHPGSPR